MLQCNVNCFHISQTLYYFPKMQYFLRGVNCVVFFKAFFCSVYFVKTMTALCIQPLGNGDIDWNG